MNQIIKIVEDLKKQEIKKTVDKRIKEFEAVIPKGEKEIFRELCFCILTAGTSAELGSKTISHLGDSIFDASEQELQKKLKEVYRFHTLRANYIFLARENFKDININHPEIRVHLVDKIKGIGMKEASHFLRNIGFKDYAIVDFHIVDILANNGVIEKPKTMTKTRYIEIENALREIAKKLNMSLAELDLYLWYKETGKVLK